MFRLPPLPYAYEALSPTLSAQTMREHHDKHHAKYVETLNDLLKAAGQTAPQPLEAIVRKAAGDPKQAKLFNNAAQAWNHSFFWMCMAPAPGAPNGALKAQIDSDFGGLADLRGRFVEAGVGHFASGWVWIAARHGALQVLTTHDGANLLTQEGTIPLLVCDLWEHAYYLDHKSDRKGFLEAWFDALANWDFAANQFAAAGGGEAVWTHPILQTA